MSEEHSNTFESKIEIIETKYAKPKIGFALFPTFMYNNNDNNNNNSNDNDDDDKTQDS